jgi:hypothetical protein
MFATEHQAALLRAAVEEIKKHPETFDMSHWAEFLYENDEVCGTTCCLAGQIVRNAVPDVEWHALIKAENALRFGDVGEVGDGEPEFPMRDRALDLLGVEHKRAGPLFYQDEWPEQFITRDADASWPLQPTPEQLEARVEHWIETGE